MSDIACEKVLFKFVIGHGARTYVNECKIKDKYNKIMISVLSTPVFSRTGLMLGALVLGSTKQFNFEVIEDTVNTLLFFVTLFFPLICVLYIIIVV